MDIKRIEEYSESKVLALYKSVGWSAYYNQPEVLNRAFEKSLCVFGAYDGENLVGLIRCVGDRETIVFIQDILVRPEYQSQGIGRALVAVVLAEYAHVRQMHLLTDDTEKTVGFYIGVGFTPVEDAQCRAFTRLRY